MVAPLASTTVVPASDPSPSPSKIPVTIPSSTAMLTGLRSAGPRPSATAAPA